MDFHTWWFCFQAFAMVWKFMEAIDRTPKTDLPSTASTTLSTNEATQRKQIPAKRQNAIAFPNLTADLNSPSLIGMLMRAQMMAWPQGLASSIMNQLFQKYKPHDTFSMIDMNHLKQKIELPTPMIDMNHLKQKIELPTPKSNPQTMFEQIALLENQFKTTMTNSEKIGIVIDKLLSKYQGVLTSEMSKEGHSIMPRHIEDVTFQ